MKSIHIFLIFFLTLFLFASKCNKEKPPPHEYYMNPEVKEYMYFKSGTWWEYVDTASGEIERVNVISDTGYMKANINNKGNIHSLRETFSWTSAQYEIEGRTLALDSIGYRSITSSVHKRINGFGDAQTITFFFPLDTNFSIAPHGLSNISIHAKYDSFKVLGKVYKDVVAFHDKSNFTESGWETITYVARNFGIIRKDIHINDQSINDYWQSFLLYDSGIVQ